MKPKKRLNKLSRTFYGKRLVAAYNPRWLDYDIPLMDHYPAHNSILVAPNSWVVINLFLVGERCLCSDLYQICKSIL